MKLRVADVLTLELAKAEELKEVLVEGWVRTRRDSGAFCFLEVNDGSCLANVQVVADKGIPGYEETGRMTTGASVAIRGKVVESPGKGQKWELHALEVKLLGESPGDYPLQKKGHGVEFLREIAHLRPRTNLFGAVMRMRSKMAFAVHRFFQEKGFVYWHTPIITGNDCEGAGEMFRATTLEQGGNPKEDFFGKKTFLTVSGQLEGEAGACALGKVYTFGPTFRAENSHTSRHASEFWMIEPEMAFCDLEGDMDLAEEFLTYLVKDVLDNHGDDFDLCAKFVDKGLRPRLESVVSGKFERLSYTEAVAILEKSGRKFDYPVEWGVNLQSEHERYLTEEYFKCPVTVYDYPKAIKPFYVLVPGIGEIVGGSQREERLDLLQKNMSEEGLDEAEYGWYADLRKYGSVPHAGFGMGFERMLMYATGVSNIRDVIPFPRTPGNCEF